MGEDFRGFLKEMEETKEGGFVRIKKEVDTRYEIAAIVTKLERARRVPLLLSENVKGKNMPVVVNCYSTRGRVARGFGILKEDLSNRVNEAYMNPIPPIEVSSAPVQEVILSRGDVDLQEIPAMIYHDTDAGLCFRLHSLVTAATRRRSPSVEVMLLE